MLRSDVTKEDQMKALLLAGMGALLATGAVAQTRTQTFDGPKFEGSRTVTRDREAGTLSRDVEVTRKSDGAVATRSFDRQRTENGVTASGGATNFKGQTRNWSYERERTKTAIPHAARAAASMARAIRSAAMASGPPTASVAARRSGMAPARSSLTGRSRSRAQMARSIAR
jgi:hypothetical protein